MSRERLSQRDHKLMAYAMGGLALTSAEASGEIIYRQLGPQVVGQNEFFLLDIDQNGVDEFAFAIDVSFTTWRNCSSSTTWTSTSTSYLRGGGRGGSHSSSCVPSTFVTASMRALGAGRLRPSVLGNGAGEMRKLALGDAITPASPTDSQGVLAHFLSDAYFQSYYGGPFHGARGFVGFSASLPGAGLVAGWAQVEVLLSEQRANDLAAIRIFDYAYETTPGQSILAGDTGLLSGGHGDTDRDGDVDLDDLNNVRNHFGEQGVGIPGDDNQDGRVDLDDLNTVRNNFGVNSGANPVPEPPSLVLLAAGAAGLAALRSKRRKHEPR